MKGFRGKKGKLVRRLGINIYESPKFERILSKRPNAPGMHGAVKKKAKSEYGRQLEEKQKLKFCYGLSEKQFHNTYEVAKARKGVTGDNLLELLERRLDNVIFRLGLAITRSQARQIVGHGHIHVNGRKVNIPSYQLKEGDQISVSEKQKSQGLVKKASEEAKQVVPSWLAISTEPKVDAKVVRHPTKDDIQPVANELMIVELYSK